MGVYTNKVWSCILEPSFLSVRPDFYSNWDIYECSLKIIKKNHVYSRKKPQTLTCDSVVREQFWEGLSPVLSEQASSRVSVTGPCVRAREVTGPPLSTSPQLGASVLRSLFQPSRWWDCDAAPEAGLPRRVNFVPVNLWHRMSVAI